MSTSGIVDSVLKYKIGTTLAHIHALRTHLRLVELQWDGFKSSFPMLILDEVTAIKKHVDTIDVKMHELDAENIECREKKVKK